MKNDVGEALPRYNHYVPSFILDNFATNGKLSIFDKHTGRQFKLPPYRAMGEKDFNNVRVGSTVLSFESKFTYIENLAAPIIADIIQRKSLASLDPMDEATLHTFVIVQLLRSKRRRLDHTLVTSEIKKRWPEVDLNPLKDKVADEEFEKFFALNFSLSKLDELVAPLAAKHSYLLIKDCKNEVYISDTPVVMHNAKQYGPYGNIGIAVPHIEIYFPLSYDLVLAYLCPLTIKTTEEAHASADQSINLIFGRKFLSPQGLSVADRLAIEQSRAEVKRAKSYYAMIRNERAAPMNSDALLFLNSLQTLSSFRYLACRTDDFAFATRALSERPHWKEGIGIRIA
jgi:hypothetical protein